MSWPDAVQDCWPDDHTVESRELYERLRREAQVPVPDLVGDVYGLGPTAQIKDRCLAQRYLYPTPKPGRAAPRAEAA